MDVILAEFTLDEVLVVTGLSVLVVLVIAVESVVVMALDEGLVASLEILVVEIVLETVPDIMLDNDCVLDRVPVLVSKVFCRVEVVSTKLTLDD